MKKLIPVVAVSFLSAVFMSTLSAADVHEKQQELNKKQHELSEKQGEVQEKQAELKQVTEKAATERAQDANKSMQQVSRASKITGSKVKNTTGDSLGDIKDLVLDPDSGQVVYAVVSFGGILGMGDKLFAIPWRALHWNGDKAFYVLDLDKVTLKNAPGFDKKHWPDDSAKWEEQRQALGQFYRVTP
jgi:sporulation protein YlmC with PRC-barrel domain